MPANQLSNMSEQSKPSDPAHEYREDPVSAQPSANDHRSNEEHLPQTRKSLLREKPFYNPSFSSNDLNKTGLAYPKSSAPELANAVANPLQTETSHNGDGFLQMHSISQS